MSILRTLLSFLCLLYPLQSSAETIQKQSIDNAAFLEFHDPGWFKLRTTDGQEYIGQFYYQFIAYEDIASWKSGELFDIQFDTADGIGIFRQKTGQFYKIFFDEREHPIDFIEEHCTDLPVECLNKSAERWKTEQEFALRAHLQNLTDQAQKDEFLKNQEVWNIYADSVRHSYADLQIHKGGTIGITTAAALNMELEKSRFFHIKQFYE